MRLRDAVVPYRCIRRACRPSRMYRDCCSMAYLHCSACGAKALAVASRCPQCQHPFPSPEERLLARPPAAQAPWFIAGLILIVMAGGFATWQWQKNAGKSEIVIPVKITGIQQKTESVVTPTPVLPDTTSASITGQADTNTAPAPSESNVVRWERGVVKIGVNLRASPNKSSKVLLVLVPDDVVMLGDMLPGWRKVRVDDLTGWLDPRHVAIRPRKR